MPTSVPATVGQFVPDWGNAASVGETVEVALKVGAGVDVLEPPEGHSQSVSVGHEGLRQYPW